MNRGDLRSAFYLNARRFTDFESSGKNGDIIQDSTCFGKGFPFVKKGLAKFQNAIQVGDDFKCQTSRNFTRNCNQLGKRHGSLSNIKLGSTQVLNQNVKSSEIEDMLKKELKGKVPTLKANFKSRAERNYLEIEKKPKRGLNLAPDFSKIYEEAKKNHSITKNLNLNID
jgi:hypothetical protein